LIDFDTEDGQNEAPFFLFQKKFFIAHTMVSREFGSEVDFVTATSACEPNFRIAILLFAMQDSQIWLIK